MCIRDRAIAEALQLHKNTVYLAVKYLKEKKALTVLRSSNTHVFAINAQIAWRDSADAKRFAHFDAKVYISDFEQQSDEKPLFNTQLVAHIKPKTTKNLKKKLAETDRGSAGMQPEKG